MDVPKFDSPKKAAHFVLHTSALQNHHVMRTPMALLVLLPTLVDAQVDYFANDPVWRVRSVCNLQGGIGLPCISTDDHQYMLTGDTVIDGNIYKRTLRSGSTSGVWQGPLPASPDCINYITYGPERSFPIRQEGRALYVWNGDADELLFDFELEVGDVLPTSFNNYDESMQVTDLDSIQLNGEWRRVYTVSGTSTHTLIEGIGSDRGLFEPIGAILECGHDLECFSLNGESVYPGPECTIVMAIGGFEEQRIDIRFDAASALLTVAIPDGSAAMPIEVLDVNGRLCAQAQLSTTGGQIDLVALASGTYLVRIGARTERVVVARY